jgi:hypothetical protein
VREYHPELHPINDVKKINELAYESCRKSGPMTRYGIANGANIQE